HYNSFDVLMLLICDLVIILRTPPSTHVLYTTLSRSVGCESKGCASQARQRGALLARLRVVADVQPETAHAESSKESASLSGLARSEEHTSELQSLTNIVCRILLS